MRENNWNLQQYHIILEYSGAQVRVKMRDFRARVKDLPPRNEKEQGVKREIQVTNHRRVRLDKTINEVWKGPE